MKAGTLRMFAPKDRTFASTGYIFFFWIVGATAILTTVAMLFIRNQVRVHRAPVDRQRRSSAAARTIPNFQALWRHRSARRRRGLPQDEGRASSARIEQRTTLLASVSHDLRTAADAPEAGTGHVCPGCRRRTHEIRRLGNGPI
ncbi:MAG: hypothetical protein WDN06_08000 [Asticcacaulis sp.]